MSFTLGAGSLLGLIPPSQSEDGDQTSASVSTTYTTATSGSVATDSSVNGDALPRDNFGNSMGKQDTSSGSTISSGGRSQRNSLDNAPSGEAPRRPVLSRIDSVGTDSPSSPGMSPGADSRSADSHSRSADSHAPLAAEAGPGAGPGADATNTAMSMAMAPFGAAAESQQQQHLQEEKEEKEASEEKEEQRFAEDFANERDANMEGTAALCKDFVVYRTLGEGGQGQVVLVRHVPTKQLLALKKQSKRGMISMVQDGTFSSVKAERNALLDNDSCDFITSLYLAFQTPDDVYMVMEFAPGGSLHNFIQDVAPLDPPTADQTTLYLAEAFSAIRHMHSNGYVNRDIKPDNILIDWDGHLKLCDLGLATKEGGDLALLGTEFFYPPKGEPISFQTDYWSLGLTFVELITSKQPIFEEAQKRFPNFKDVYELHVFDSGSKLRSPGMTASTRATDGIKSLVRHLLRRDPTERLGHDAPEALSIENHRGFKGVDWDMVRQKRYETVYRPTAFMKGGKKPGRSILVTKDKNRSFMGKMLSSLKKTMSEEEHRQFQDWEYASEKINEGSSWQLDELRLFCVDTVSRITQTNVTQDDGTLNDPGR